MTKAKSRTKSKSKAKPKTAKAKVPTAQEMLLDKLLRVSKKDNKELCKALATACDLALDATDVIHDEDICDPEDGEDDDLRERIMELRKLSKQPAAERHEMRAKERAARTPVTPEPTVTPEVVPELAPEPASEVAVPDANPNRIGIDSDGEYMIDGKRW